MVLWTINEKILKSIPRFISNENVKKLFEIMKYIELQKQWSIQIKIKILKNSTVSNFDSFVR